MIAICSKCGEKFESVIVDRKLALKEIATTSTDHVRRKHKEVFEQLAGAIQKVSLAVATYIHFDECLVVPENETFIQEQLNEVQEIIMMAIGFDPEEEEEDEPESDDEPRVGEIELPDEEDHVSKEVIS